MFTTGKIIFAAVFFLVFVLGMWWSFKKDKSVNTIHFKGASKTLILILLGFLILFLFVKFRKLL